MDTFFQDVRYALRGLLRSRGFTAVAVLTLALGIGANASIFSFLDALLLRPYDFPDMERLVVVSEQSPSVDRLSLSAASLADILEGVRGLEQVGAYTWWDPTLTGTGSPERLVGYRVLPDLFTALGARAALGRLLVVGEEQEGQPRVVVLSHALWMQRFGGEPSVLNRTLMLDGEPFTVVGVMPPDFRFPAGTQLWVPLVLPARERDDRSTHKYEAVAKLKPGVLAGQVLAEFSALEPRLSVEDPGHRLTAIPMQQAGEPAMRQMMWVLMASVVLVLLIACTNVAGMLLARSAKRAKELAIRASLGASRVRLVRQLLTESLLLATLGGLLGLLLAVGGLELIRAGVPADITRFIAGWNRVGLNPWVLTFTCLVVMAATLLFGLVPALRASQVNPGEVLKSGGSGGSGHRQRLRQVLISLQIAFALVLTVCAALTASSFSRMLEAPVGFQRAGVLTLLVSPTESKYPSAVGISRFYEEALARLRTLPGVRSVAAVSDLPLGPGWNTGALLVEGTVQQPGREPQVPVFVVTEEYFQTLDIALIEGVVFSAYDGPEAPPAVIVSESFARRHFGGAYPLGRRLAVGKTADGQPLWRTVTGVVADARQVEFLGERDALSVVYVPQRQMAQRAMRLMLRSGGDPLALAPLVRNELMQMDFEQPISQVKSLERVIEESMLGPRYAMVLLLVFASIALLMSAVGVYGVMAHNVAMRTHEIGVRMALGARRGDVVRLIVGQTLRPTLGGVAMGVLGAWVCSRAMAGILYGVNAFAPGLFALVALFLVAVALLAALVPVINAIRVDPINALRAE